MQTGIRSSVSLPRTASVLSSTEGQLKLAKCCACSYLVRNRTLTDTKHCFLSRIWASLVIYVDYFLWARHRCDTGMFKYTSYLPSGSTWKRTILLWLLTQLLHLWWWACSDSHRVLRTNQDQTSTAASAPITIRTRKFITNRLLSRRQFVIDVFHPCRPNVSRAELAKKLAVVYNSEPFRVVLFGLHTHFGGQHSTGFGLIYDDEASQIKFEFRNRLVKVICCCLYQVNACLTHHCRFSPVCAIVLHSTAINFERISKTGLKEYVRLPFSSYSFTDLQYHKFRGREAGVQRAKSRKFK
jgi:small subunit ribosomal protein S24e